HAALLTTKVTSVRRHIHQKATTDVCHGNSFGEWKTVKKGKCPAGRSLHSMCCTSRNMQESQAIWNQSL
ncbi:MAG: hypothetical protein ACI4OJ_13885, partial [Lachnospiraceae bacterium]